MKSQTFNKKRQLTLKYKCGRAAGPTFFHLSLPQRSAGSKPRKQSPGKTLDPRTRPGTSVAALRDPDWRWSPRAGQWSPGVSHLGNREPSNAGAQIVERGLQEAPHWSLGRAKGDKCGNLRGVPGCGGLSSPVPSSGGPPASFLQPAIAAPPGSRCTGRRQEGAA